MENGNEFTSADHDTFGNVGHSDSFIGDEGQQKVFEEYSSWYSRLRHSRLAAKVDHLWRLLREGGLSRKEIAVVVAALLYCISPFDLTPDFIPVIGFLDDLLIVVATLAYLERNRSQADGADQTIADEDAVPSSNSTCHRMVQGDSK